MKGRYLTAGPPARNDRHQGGIIGSESSAFERSLDRPLADIRYAIGEIRSSLERLYEAVPAAVRGDRRGVINALAAARFLEHVCWEWRNSSARSHPDIAHRWQQILSFLAGTIPKLRVALSTENDQGGREVLDSLRRVADRLQPLEAEITRLEVAERRSRLGGAVAEGSAGMH